MSFPFDSNSHLQQQQQQQQKEDQRTFLAQAHVENFLTRSGLGQYNQIFIEEGFDRLDSLFEVTEADLIQLGVKRGHRRLLQRAIANSKGIPSSLPLQINPETIIRRSDILEYDHSLQTAPGAVYSQDHVHLNSTNGNNTSINPNAGSNSTNSTNSITNTNTNGNVNSNGNSIHNLNHSHNLNHNHNHNNHNNHHNNIASPMPLASPRSSSAGPSISHVSTGAATSGMSSTEDDNTPGDSTGRLWKRKYQRHAKPDKNCPLKPSSAYVMFSNDVRAELRSRNMTFTELAKLVGDRWKNLNHDEKQRYETNAMVARKQYQIRLEDYQRTTEFKQYQEYIRDFKAKHEAAGKIDLNYKYIVAL
ncbi:hypothetical protein J3Q64DRAFT_1259000 [Phycomyces blakesleeanus]|uniref:HMG box domain-containing protein n=1 Tax=Phycomyces blakesleeanus TaxID=4837 RepID=A0ABR3AQH9_PHYBL